MIKKIKWNGFLKQCINEYPKEAVAVLYASQPYTENERWYAFPVKNAHPKPENNWIPEKKDWEEIKKLARGLQLIKIGNIHTHPYPKGMEFKEEMLQTYLLPSEKDIKCAMRYRDLVRGIIVCNNKAIYDIRFHSTFGIGKVDIKLEGVDEDD